MRWDQMKGGLTAAEQGNARAAGICAAVTRVAQIERHRLVRHVFVSRNFGLLGGWLRAEVYCFAQGDPSGITASRVEHLQPPWPGSPGRRASAASSASLSWGSLSSAWPATSGTTHEDQHR